MAILKLSKSGRAGEDMVQVLRGCKYAWSMVLSLVNLNMVG